MKREPGTEAAFCRGFAELASTGRAASNHCLLEALFCVERVTGQTMFEGALSGSALGEPSWDSRCGLRIDPLTVADDDLAVFDHVTDWIDPVVIDQVVIGGVFEDGDVG